MKEVIAALAFDVFCWAIGKTREEYISEIGMFRIIGYLESAEQDFDLPDGSLSVLLSSPTPKQLAELKKILKVAGL